MKIVYIAHPIRGDVENNIAKVERILKYIHTNSNFKDVFPIAPYLQTLKYLNDEKEEDRAKGVNFNYLLFSSRFVDELWVCSMSPSAGVDQEICWAVRNRIPVYLFKATFLIA